MVCLIIGQPLTVDVPGVFKSGAQRRGYVTHCIGSFDRVDLRNEFQMSENLELYGIVALGRPAATEVTQKEKQMPRKSVNSVLLLSSLINIFYFSDF